MTKVSLSPSAITAVGISAEVAAMLARLGAAVRDDARIAAPKASGAGAASIDYEVGVDFDGAYVKVSWDEDHYYMLYQEIGTSEVSARPFLRPAVTKRRTI